MLPEARPHALDTHPYSYDVTRGWYTLSLLLLSAWLPWLPDSMQLLMTKYTHPQENVLGGVESSSIDAGRIGCAAFTHDAAGVARDGALC